MGADGQTVAARLGDAISSLRCGTGRRCLDGCGIDLSPRSLLQTRQRAGTPVIGVQ